MKKFIILLLIFSVVLSTPIQANNASSLYKTDTYSVDVLDTLETDDETLQDYTSFYNDNVHIGITITDNLRGENVAMLTENEIKTQATDTLHAILAQSGEGINIKEHAIISFSDHAYPALYVAYEGSSELDDSVYMEQYIITTISYKYTIVFSADTKELLECEEVEQFKRSFTPTETPLTTVERIEDNTLANILIASIIGVIALFVITVFIISAKQKRKRL